jgi:pyruvate-formate lyase-activating enzyme
MKAILKPFIKKIVPDAFIDPLLQSFRTGRYIYERLSGTAYYCKALSGESNYNISINSDMTVSCNCQDYYGSGHLGDLNVQTWEEIFHGERARLFRKRLARGQYATPICPDCRELQRIRRQDAAYFMTNYQLPRKGIMVENTSLCMLKCLQCDRTSVMKIRKRKIMSQQDMEKVANTVRTHNIRTVSFHNLGEPFFSDMVYEHLSILRRHNPHLYIWTSTSGLLLNSEKKREAALLADHILFSIDGSSQELVNKYQVGGNFARSYGNMKRLVNARNSRNAAVPVIVWKYVVFSWNDSADAVEKAIDLAREAGVDIISFVPGTGAPSHVSQRYVYDPFFQRLGRPSCSGREIDFRKEHTITNT